MISWHTVLLQHPDALGRRGSQQLVGEIPATSKELEENLGHGGQQTFQPQQSGSPGGPFSSWDERDLASQNQNLSEFPFHKQK